MATIIRDRGYWTQNDHPPSVPVGTQIVAMGSYGGRGLYLHGIASGGWEPTGDVPFRNKLAVTWAHVIYDVPGDPEDVGALVHAFNPRSWSRCSQSDFRAVLDRVLSGREVPVPSRGAA
ncbi:MAG TPA: hypothetical protein VFY45_18465 [Baekduia sp.]|nr:hypothetical protein [Baekduia sp.]